MLHTYLLVLLNLNHDMPRGHAADLAAIHLARTQFPEIPLAQIHQHAPYIALVNAIANELRSKFP
jgi:hypothetical protein